MLLSSTRASMDPCTRCDMAYTVTCGIQGAPKVGSNGTLHTDDRAVGNP